VNVHVWNALYGHRISGRLNLVVGGGPQLLVIHNPPIVLLGLVFPVPTTQRISGNGNVRLGYTFSSRTSVQLGYQHYVTPGSGFLAGANTDAVRLSLSHVFGRRWTGTADGGYSHNSSLLQKGTTSAGLGARSYQYWYSGASLHRQLGQHFAAFVSYQFNDFGSTGCAKTGTTCGQTSQRHTGIVGIDWHPHPIRLD
jgi:hypothetical protein